MIGPIPIPRPPGADALDQAIDAAQRGNGLTALDILHEIIAEPPLLGDHWAAVVQLCGQLDDDAALAAARRLRAAVPDGVTTATRAARRGKI